MLHVFHFLNFTIHNNTLKALQNLVAKNNLLTLFPQHSQTYLSTEPFLHAQKHVFTSQETQFSQHVSNPYLGSLQKGENNETPDVCFSNDRTVAGGTIIFTMKN